MNFIVNDIDKSKIENYKEICDKMKELTKNLKENIEKIEQIDLEQIDLKKDKKLESKKLKPKNEIKPAGRIGSRMDKNTINWKDTLRRHWL